MKTNRLMKIGALLGAGCIATASPLLAQNSADKLDEWKKARQEFQAAERELVKESFGDGDIERDIARLTQRRVEIEKKLPYLRSKADLAGKSTATSLDPALSAEARKTQAYWESELKGAEAELADIEKKLQGRIKDLQKKILSPDEPNILLPGDAVQLFVLEDESFNGLYQIRRGGYVILPRVGRVTIAGKDLVAAEKEIKAALESTQLRQGTVMLERSREVYAMDSNDVIYLSGEFTTPGPMRIPEGFKPTIVTTLLRAGGVTKSADMTHVKLLRLEGGKALVEEVDVKAILDGSGLQSDLALNPGDIIVVPAFAPVVYVTGNVTRPGVLTLSTDEELTAYSAILRSGGFARFASKRKVYVLRDHGNGEKSKIPVNIKDLQAGKVQDVVLQGRDIIVVPESWFSF